MQCGSVFNEKLYHNVIKELNEECKIDVGYSAQVAGSRLQSPATTAIVSYSLSKLGILSNVEKEMICRDILSFKCGKEDYYKSAIGNEESITVWSTSLSVLALVELEAELKEYVDTIEWLYKVQNMNGGWTYNGKDDEVERIGYCFYPLLVMSKVRKYVSSAADAIEKAEGFVNDYKPSDTCEKLIKYYLQVHFYARERDEDEEELILMQFVQENYKELNNYVQVEPGSGGHHFYVPWYAPSFYLWMREFISPDHPAVLLMLKWLKNNVIGGKGWPPNIYEKRIYSWATALSILTIEFWNRDCIKKSVLFTAINDETEVMRRIVDFMEENRMVQYLNVCLINGGKCNLRNEIREGYNEKNIFLDIPYNNRYKTFEKQIIETTKNKGFEPIAAKQEVKSKALLCKICKMIQTCRYGIADISESSLNIPFELGLMYGLGKKCAILKRTDVEMPGDLKALEYLPYENTDELNDILVKWIEDNT